MSFLSYSELGIGVANLAGYLALVFITATAVLMFAKKRLLEGRFSSHKTFFLRTHIVVAVLGGGFLLVHADYFIRAPIFNWGIFLGYLSTAIALVVWFTGFSFLERLRYSLLYHGSLSLVAISLMYLHAIYLGFNISLELAELILVGIVAAAFIRAIMHASKIASKTSRRQEQDSSNRNRTDPLGRT
jgi:hypothetical protein